MPLSRPIHSFTLPSAYDGIELACYVHHPPSGTPSRGGVILAHPYASLGGSSSDPVIALLVETCLDSGFTVTTFDFRGAGRSAGKTSWTSKPEGGDYLMVAAFVATYLREIWRLQGRDDGIVVILGGYSYGSMIARQIPPVTELKKRFDKHERMESVSKKASLLAQEYTKTATTSLSSRVLLRPTMTTSYLLVSPLLWPVSSVLSLQLPFLSSNDHADTSLTSHKTLAIFGGKDIFSSSKRLQTWAQKLASQPDSRFSYQHISEAGHFWHEPGAGRQLQDAVGAWLKESFSDNT
jgi:alpha/beta superfamily hydrolase